MKLRAQLQLQVCTTPEEEQERQRKLAKCEEFFMDLHKPKTFTANARGNAVIEFENQFQQMISGLEANNVKTQGLTVLELYSRIMYFNKMNERLEAKKNKND